MTTRYPQTQEGVVTMIVASLIKSETTYVSFCKELDQVKVAADEKLMKYFCNNQCAIHKLHNSNQLLCLPKSSQALLKKMDGLGSLWEETCK